jgi:transposase
MGWTPPSQRHQRADAEVSSQLTEDGSVTMNAATATIDLAQHVVQVPGVHVRGKVVLRRQRRHEQMGRFLVNIPPCLNGTEACASSHRWGRPLERFGHAVRLMAPQFVTPNVTTKESDSADAEPSCEAVSRPTMRFVPIRSIEQQAVLSVHRGRRSSPRCPRRRRIRSAVCRASLVR